jgi:hypothetical protein
MEILAIALAICTFGVLFYLVELARHEIEQWEKRE